VLGDPGQEVDEPAAAVRDLGGVHDDPARGDELGLVGVAVGVDPDGGVDGGYQCCH